MTVYILADRGNNRIKIGFAKDAQKRLKTHATSNPGLEVLAILGLMSHRKSAALFAERTSLHWDNGMVRRWRRGTICIDKCFGKDRGEC